MNTNNKRAIRKHHPIWGLVLAIIGGALTLVGIYILLVTVLTELSSNWHVVVLSFGVASILILLGISLLILGNRRYKNVPKEEQINWGWAAAITGGLLTLFGIDNILIEIFSDLTADVKANLQCTIPILLSGVPLLILGIRKIEKVRAGGVLPLEKIERRKRKQRIWGWVLVAVGGLITFCGIGFLVFVFYLFFILSPRNGYAGPYQGYLRDSFIMEFVTIVIPVVIIGVTLVIPGFLMLKKSVISRQARGRIFLIMGGVYLFVSVLNIVYTADIIKDDIFILALYLPLFLILGILGIVFGIRDLTRKGNMLTGNMDDAKNQTIEMDDELKE